MKETLDNLRDFIVADKKSMNIIKSSLTEINKLINESKGEKREFYRILFITVRDIAKALSRAGKISSRKQILKKKLEANYKRILKRLGEIDQDSARIFWLFFWYAKIVIELNVGYNLPIYNNTKKMRMHYNDIIDKLQKAILYSLLLEDTELLTEFWTVTSTTMTNMIRIIVRKQDISEALNINTDFKDFLLENESSDYINWFKKSHIDIQLQRGDCYYFDYDYINAQNEYRKSRARYMEESLDNPFQYLRILERLSYVLYREGYIEESINVIQEALTKAEKLPKRKIKVLRFIVKYNHYLGGLYTEKFDSIKFSMIYFKRAFDKIKKIEKENIPEITETKADLMYNFGMYHIITGNTTKALEYFNEALTVLEELEQRYTKSQFYAIAELLWKIQTTFIDYFSKDILDEYYKNFIEIIQEKNKYKFTKVEFVEAIRYHAQILKHRGEFKKCLEKIEQGLEKFNKLPRSIRELYNSKIIKAKLHREKTQIMFLFSDYQIAETEIAQSLSNELFLTRKPRDLYKLLNFYKDYANVLVGNNKLTLAKNLFFILKDFIKQLSEKYPEIYNSLLIRIGNDKAILHLRIGEFDDSILELQQADEKLEVLISDKKSELKESNFKLKQVNEYDSYNELIGSINDNFGLVYLEKNDFDIARKHLEKALKARRKLFLKYKVKYITHYQTTINHYSLVLSKLGLRKEAEELLRRSIRDLKELEKLDLPNLKNLQLISFINLGLLLFRIKKEKESLNYYEKAYQLIKKGGISEVLSVVQKAKISWMYIVIQITNQNLKSKLLDELVLFDTIKDAENLPVLDKQKIKSEIEHLYMWLLAKELTPLEDKQNILWSKMNFIFKIVSTLRSGESFLFKSNQGQNEVTDKSKDSYNEIVNRIYQITKEKLEINNQLLTEDKSKPLHEGIQDKNFLLNRLTSINKVGYKLISTLKSLNQSNTTIELLKEYLELNEKTCLYIIQSTPHRILHLCLNSKSILVKTTTRDFISKGEELENVLSEISKIDSINEKEEFDQKEKIIKQLSNDFWIEIPESIRNLINQSNKIILSLCNKTQNIPFEIIGDKNHQLGLNKIITRIFEIESSFIALEKKEFDNNPEREDILFLVDPEDKKLGYLPDAINEANDLSQMFEKENFSVDMLVNEDVNYTNLVNSLSAKPKIIHYIGHGVDDGIIISPNQRLNPSVITNYYLWFANNPLIYLSTCIVGRTCYRGAGIFDGLIPSLLRRNSKTIIASKNKVFDDNSRKFSNNFYKSLISGLSIGEALLETRRKNLEEYIWGNYLLFGDPDLKLN